MINTVIDLSHYNATVDFSQIASAGILGVFHKATQGATYADPMYQARKTLALGAGLLWGAYHFGDASDVATQVDNFLTRVKPGPTDLLALDVERGSSNSMSLAQAEQFVAAVFQATGRWPGLYCGSYLKSLLNGSTQSSLKNCWLWYAEYAGEPLIPALWPTWTLWQYTDGSNGPTPHAIAGVGSCDRDQFNGEAAQLYALWGVAGPVSG